MKSKYFGGSWKKSLLFYYIASLPIYRLTLCFTGYEVATETYIPMSCEHIYLDNQHIKTWNHAKVEVPMAANFINITIPCTDLTDYADTSIIIKNFTVFDTKDGHIYVPMHHFEIKDIKTFDKLAAGNRATIRQYQNNPTYSCVTDMNSQLKYDGGNNLTGFYVNPIYQWVHLEGDLSNYQIYFHNTLVNKRLTLPKIGVQLAPAEDDAELVSNPIPCMDLDKREAFVIVKYWATENVDVKMCQNLHITSQNFYCTKSSGSDEISFYKTKRFPLQIRGIKNTFEIKLHISTEHQDGFLILDKIEVSGALCSDTAECSSENNLNSISELTDPEFLLNCTAGSLISDCHWKAKTKSPSKDKKYSFYFPHTTPRKKCDVRIMFSKYFNKIQGAKLHFTYTSTGIDYLIHVCFVESKQITYAVEDDEMIGCGPNLILRENEQNQNNTAAISIPSNANRVYIHIAYFGAAEKVSEEDNLFNEHDSNRYSEEKVCGSNTSVDIWDLFVTCDSTCSEII